MPAANRAPSVPFPSDVPTAPLRVIDYAGLIAYDPVESKRLFQSSVDIGFFMLKNHGLDFEPLKDVCEEVFALPQEEKDKYDVAKYETSFGYKRIGTDNVDELGAVDTNEQFNISRDDLVAWPKRVHNDYPKPVRAAHQQLRDFTYHSRNVALTLLKHFERHLDLPEGTLQRIHEEGNGHHSPTKARVIRNPAQPKEEGDRLALGSHTDFGSITLLDNTMTGGLQVLLPGTEEWLYVQPLEGHIVVNLADALSILSGGILRSNVHRVLPPPGPQRACERWSGIFFLVPEYQTVLEPLERESDMIRQAAKGMKNRPAPGTTCRQWFERRLYGVRAVNRTGPESWLNSRGTEHVVVEGRSGRASISQSK